MFVVQLVILIVFGVFKFSTCDCNGDAFSKAIFDGCKAFKLECAMYSVDGCVKDINITHLYLISLVTTIKRGSFVDNPILINLDMSNNTIAHLERNAFQNNKLLMEIHLQFNNILQIFKNVFTGLGVNFINLSHNKIMRVGNGVFGGMQGSESLILYLDYNQISSIHPSAFIDSKIITITLSYNKLKSIKSGTFSKLEQLRYLDLSFNFIHTIEKKSIDGETNRYLKELNLAANKLTDVDFFTKMRVNNLYVSSNNISRISVEAMAYVNVTSMYVDPNPWICECLWQFFKNKNDHIKVKSPKLDFNFIWAERIPICVSSLHGKCESDDRSHYDLYNNAVNWNNLMKK